MGNSLTERQKSRADLFGLKTNSNKQRRAVRFSSAFFLVLIILVFGCVSQEISEVRPNYGLNETIFEELPDFPDDFSSVDNQVYLLRNLSGFKDIAENYYKQPEFYPTWETSGVGGFKNPPSDRFGYLGLGAYPADQFFAVGAGEEAELAFFLYSSWLVGTYQGMKMNIINPNPEFFDVSVVPDVLLIGPNYPKFDKNWAQKIIVDVKISKNTTEGSYIIGINPSAPPSDVSELLRQQSNGIYVSFSASLDRPYFKLTLNIKSSDG